MELELWSSSSFARGNGLPYMLVMGGCLRMNTDLAVSESWSLEVGTLGAEVVQSIEGVAV